MTTELGLPDDRSSVDGGKDRMEYRVLGPVEARRDGELLDLGTKQRSLLALLLVEANRVVSIDRIIDELWGVDAGRDRQNMVVGEHLEAQIDARTRPHPTQPCFDPGHPSAWLHARRST